MIDEPKRKTITLVCGSRNKSQEQLLMIIRKVENALRLLDRNKNIILSGGAEGADWAARIIAQRMNMEYIEAPANWKLLGKSAGYKRNITMSELADRCIAFWDGKSPGTRNMLELFNKTGKPLWVVEV